MIGDFVNYFGVGRVEATSVNPCRTVTTLERSASAGKHNKGMSRAQSQKELYWTKPLVFPLVSGSALALRSWVVTLRDNTQY